jgi:uncharacterized membrane protein
MKTETNTILAVFENEAEAKQAYGDFYKAGIGGDYVIDAAALYTKKGYQLKRLNSFSGMGSSHFALFGWMIGALVGVFFGWKGLLVGALAGMTIGVILDDRSQRKIRRELNRLAACLPADRAGIVLLAEESSATGINTILEHYSMRAVRSRAEKELPVRFHKARAVQTNLH